MNPTKLLKNSGVAAVIYAMSEQLQSELSQIGDALDDNRWKLGKIANSLKAEVDKRRMEYKDESGATRLVSIQDVYTACSIATNRKVSARTIAYYAMLEEFYPPDIRDRYDPLPITHFAFAHQFKERCTEILDLAYSKYELSGRMPSEEWLRLAWAEKARMDGIANITDIMTEEVSEEMSQELSMPADGAREYAQTHAAGWVAAEQLYRLVQSISGAALTLPIDDGIKDELQKAIETLTKVLDKVMFAVEKKRS